MAARGASPARPPAGNAAAGPPSQEARNAANFRTVARNDPALAEILDTSAYGVMYRYEDETWQKKKQEGPLFVVRRNKAPEFALFMLNRILVKNVTVPLYPGEMKISIIGGNGEPRMLQIARRGDKSPYGIWFPDGSDSMERLREALVRVCGEPVKPPPGANAVADASPRGSPAPAAAAVTQPPTGGDGLSRLFAGLTTVPSAKSSSSSQASPKANQPAPHPNQPAPPQLPGIHGQHSPYPLVPGQTPPVQGVPTPPVHQQQQTPQSEQAPQQQLQAGPAAAPMPQPAFRPGETVDDLMKGLLYPTGMGFPPGAPPAQPPAAQTLPAPAAQITPPSGSPARPAPGPIPAHARQQQSHTSSPHGSGTPTNSGPDNAPMQLYDGRHEIPAATQAVMRDALLSVFVPEGVGLSPVPKQHFVATLVYLLESNPRFGDDVWRAYLLRCGVTPP